MKIKNFFKLAFLAVLVISIIACSDDDDNNNSILGPNPDTITNFIANNTEYSVLFSILQKTGYDVVLNGSENFTVFAPNNAAFTTYLNGVNLDDISTDVLTQLLLNHVLETTVVTDSLSTGYWSNLATEAISGGNISMYIDTVSGIQINGQTTVVTKDIEKDNGVIHIVDSVIELPTMQTFLDLDSSLSTFKALATTTPGFQIDFESELPSQENKKITLLAPDNAAFDKLGNISDIPIADLEQILLNHVILETNISSDLITSYLNTLATYNNTENNLSIYVSTKEGISFNGVSKVSTVDIVASNGVIHKVDTVIGLPTVVDFVTADPNFSTLDAALTSIDFVTTLGTPDGTVPAPFTVFAPANDAFGSLLTELELTNLEEIVDPTLTSILNLHVIEEANVRAEDLVTGIVTTIGGDINIDATNLIITDTNDRTSEIIAIDVQASNGLIHVIDQVLLPAVTVDR